MEGSLHSHPLDYAQPQAARKRLWRRIELSIITLLILFVLGYVGPIAWRNVRLVQLQRACLSHQYPADKVVLSEKAGIALTSPEWTVFHGTISSAPRMDQATIYLHERTSPNGTRRLVSVLGYVGVPVKGPAGASGLAPVVRVYRLGTPTSPPREVLQPRDPRYQVFDGSAGLTVFGGQSDPKDLSHFTIRMLDGAREVLLDGWLRDDDSILLEPRSTPPAASTLTEGP